MRKQRMAKVRRGYNGRCSEWTDWYTRDVYDIVDRATFRGEYYLLVKAPDGYGIFKMISAIVAESVKLSSRKLLKDKRSFESPSIWERKSAVKISDTGLTVEEAKHEKPIKFQIRICGMY